MNKKTTRKQINIRIMNIKSNEIFNEWEAKFLSKTDNYEVSKNTRLEQILIKGMIEELTENKISYFEDKIQNIFEKNVNTILKRVFGRQDLIALNFIKFFKIDEMKMNFLIHKLEEAEIIKNIMFSETSRLSRQQTADMPWVVEQKNNLDSEFAYLQKTEIIKDFASITKDSFVLQGEIKEDLMKSIDLLNKETKKEIKTMISKNVKNTNKKNSENNKKGEV